MEHPAGLQTPTTSDPAATGSPRAPQPPAAPLSGSSGLPAVLEADVKERRWQLVRDVAVFQAKLVVDGLKDLVLSPVSLVAAILGLLVDRRDPGRSFYTLLRWGHGFDRWVNLFGASQRALPPAPDAGASLPSASPPSASTGEGLDAYVTRLERVLVDQYRRGGLTAKAKDAIDQAIDGLQTRNKRPPG